MFDKLLAFAGVTAVAGFGLAFTIGGCSSSDPATPVEDNAGADAGQVKDSGRPRIDNEPEPEEEACGPKGEASTIASMDAQFGWKPPAARQNACTAADLAAIEGVTSATSYRDFVAGTSAACQACALSTKDAATWGPIVLLDAEGKQGIANFGACFAAVDSEDCGKAMQYLELCVGATCSACTIAPDRTECVQASVAEQCKAVYAEAQAKCTKADASDACGSLVKGIKYLCAYEAADGGS